MGPQALEDDRADNQDGTGHQPVVGGQSVVLLPEPDMVNEALPVPLHKVVDRVELDHVEVLDGEYLGGPEDWGHPEEELDHHPHDLPHVAEEEDHRGGDPGDAEKEDDGGEEVVEDLQAVDGERHAVDEEHDEDDADEEGVQHQGGEDLHYG